MEKNISDYSLTLYNAFNLLETKSEVLGRELGGLVEKMALLDMLINGITAQSHRNMIDLTSMKTLQSENLAIMNNMTENIAEFAYAAQSGLARLNETAYNTFLSPSKLAVASLIVHGFKTLVDGLPQELYGLLVVMKWLSCILAASWIFCRSIIVNTRTLISLLLGFSLLFIKRWVNIGARQSSSSRQKLHAPLHIPGIRVSRIPDRLYRKIELV
ncbi:hypothetical protein Clacol_005790 [Clathrus columnatus]|uniref:Uncharacterized protein n=1 Tax=Clathrus columnatus TaxID=1419009 RepID=A0AAV5AGD7_9AGAM|nr:hypothetical protein Clacol_005790 [Clathrus columnatus]